MFFLHLVKPFSYPSKKSILHQGLKILNHHRKFIFFFFSLEHLTPSVPSSNTLIKSSSSDKSTNLVLLPSSPMTSLSFEQIDIFVQIVNSLRTELFPKLNNFLSSM
jgi:hypothetical protein